MQWALGAHHPGFVSQLREHHGWVLEQAGAVLGFVTLSDDGHLSLLYVSADHQRQGWAASCSPLPSARPVGSASRP